MGITGGGDSELIMCGEPFRRPQAREAGLGRDRVTRLVETGLLRQVLRGVHLDARVPDDLVVRAACLRLTLPPDAVVCRRTAAWLLGIDGRSPGERAEPLPLECAVPSGRQPIRRPGVTGSRRRRKAPSASWEVSRARHPCGRRSTSCAGAHPTWAWAWSTPWPPGRIVDAGFPRPQAQVPVHDPSGALLALLDLGWHERKVAVEYDGEEFHSSPSQVAHDRRRRDMLERGFGWRVLAVGRGEVPGRSMALERAVGELLSCEPRSWRRAW